MSATQLDQTVLDTLYASFRIQFKDGMQKATKCYEEIATAIQSHTLIENYPIIDQLGKMREWIGPRKMNDFRFRTLSVKNRDFENTIRINRDAIADEQIGLYGSLIAGLGTTSENLWDDLIFDALCTDQTWLDGKEFFDETRTYSDGMNKICNSSENELTYEEYTAARDKMMSYVGSMKRPLNVIPDILIVGPHFASTAQRIVTAKYMRTTEGLVDNPMYGTAKLIVSTRLVGDHFRKWFLIASNDVIKPIILQQRETPKLTRIDSDSSEYVFINNENLYGTFARGAVALTVPHLIFGGGRIDPD